MGCRDDDANSVDYLSNQVEDLKADALVLCGISPWDLRYLTLGERLAYQAGLPSLQVKQEDVIARKRLSHYFEEHLENSLHIYVDEETDNLYEADH